MKYRKALYEHTEVAFQYQEFLLFLKCLSKKPQQTHDNNET